MKLAEAIVIRAGEQTIPWIAAGEVLPLVKRERLSTARDRQESVRCELVVGARSVAFVEVGVRAAPRGVPKLALEIRIDADGSANVLLQSDDGGASAMFSIATTR